MIQHPVDKAKRQCLIRIHEVIPLAGGSDLLHRTPGVLRQDPVHSGLDGFQTLEVNCHVRDLPLGTGGGLMNHDLRIGQRHTLALCTRAEQECSHACCHTHTDCSHITLDVLHSVINRHPCGDTAAGAVDIKLNILVRILGLQVQKLRNNQAGGGIIDFFRQENNAVIQQAGKNVLAAFSPAGLLNTIGNYTHGNVSFHRV